MKMMKRVKKENPYYVNRGGVAAFGGTGMTKIRVRVWLPASRLVLHGKSRL